MATFHNHDDEILLDDEIGQEEHQNTMVPTLSFDRIEQNLEAREAGTIPSASFCLTPTVEENDSQFDDDDDSNRVNIQVSPSFSRNSATGFAPSRTPLDVPETINDYPHSSYTTPSHYKQSQQREESFSSFQPDPVNPTHVKFSSHPHSDDDDDILFDDEVGELPTHHKNTSVDDETDLQSTTSHFNFTTLMKLEAENDQDDSKANSNQQIDENQHSPEVQQNINELILATTMSEGDELVFTRNGASPRKNAPTPHNGEVQVSTEVINQRKPPPACRSPTVAGKAIPTTGGSTIEFTPIKLHNSAQSPKSNLSNAELRLRKEMYENPSNKSIVSTSNNVRVDFDILPPLGSVRLLRHQENLQLERYKDPYLHRKPNKDERLVQLFGRWGLYDHLGLYKWIVLGVSWLALLVVALPLSSSLYTRMFELHFNISRSTASWFPSLQIGIFCLFNLFSPQFCDLFGSYPVLAVSFFFTLIGFLIPSLLNEFYSILIIHSVFVGGGSGGIQISVMYLLNDYFSTIPGDQPAPNIIPPTKLAYQPGGDKSKQQTADAKVNSKADPELKEVVQPVKFSSHQLSTSFAIGFVLSAFGIGNIIWSPFINYFLDKHIHYKEAFLWSGAFVFGLGLIILVFLRPRSHSVAVSRRFLSDEITYRLLVFISSLPEELRYHLNIGHWDTIVEDILDHSFSTSLFSGFKLFKKTAFCLLFVSAVLGSVLFYAPFIHLIPHSEDFGLDYNDTSVLLIIIGVVSFFSRLFFAFLVEFFHPFISFAIALIFQLVTAITWYFSDSIGMFQLTAFFTGLSSAAFVVSVSVLNKKIHKIPSTLVAAQGMLYGLAFFPAAVVLGPVMGAVQQFYGSYDRVLLALIVIAAISFFFGTFILFAALQRLKSDEELAEWNLKKRKEEQTRVENKIQAEKEKKERNNSTADIEFVASSEPTKQLESSASTESHDSKEAAGSTETMESKPRARPTVFTFLQQDKNASPPSSPVASASPIAQKSPRLSTDGQPTQNDKNLRLDDKKHFGQYCSALLKQRSVFIDTSLRSQIFFTYLDTIPELSTQYAIALARWYLGYKKVPGWSNLY